MAVGEPPLLLRVLALASILPILELYALTAMDSNPALSPPAADEEGASRRRSTAFSRKLG
jgi:hypothetical protein